VRLDPAARIVAFLSYSSDPGTCAHELTHLNRKEWERIFTWLDFSGLAFYFLQKLKQTNTTYAIPASVMSHLERNFEANRERVSYMSQRFTFLSQKFNDAGIRYAVLKGFSIVPEFCPDPLFRYQGDFDYLVEERSVSEAQRILVEAGYRAKPSPSSQEFIFVPLEMGEPSHRPDQYYARTPHGVELHLDIWDSDLDRIWLVPRLLCVERAVTRQFNGLRFPALADEDAFLLQVLHTCHHLFSHWVRMSCLFEIGYFLSRRAVDMELWSRVEQRVGESVVLREFVVVVTELAAQLFEAPLPQVVRDWSSRIRPGPRVWIDNYARHWAFGEMPIHQFSLFPRAKLVHLLHQEYRDDTRAQTTAPVHSVLPPSRLSRIATSIRKQPWILLNITWWRRNLLIQRSMFHVLAGLRYFFEIPRWTLLKWARMRLASQDSGQDVALDHQPPVVAPR
jgi:hypothetical protein